MLTFSRRCVLLTALSVAAGSSAEDLIDSGFKLPTCTNTPVELSLADSAAVNVLFFVGTECPLVRQYGPRVQQIVDSFNEGRGEASAVRVIGVSSSRQDSIDDLREFIDEYEIRFPIGKDVGNVVADQFAVKRMSEVVVLDNLLQVRYRGRIDDEYQPGIARGAARSHELRDAIASILAGKPVAVTRTEPVGCLIGRVRTGPITTKLTYTKDIASVLNKHCVECHRAGEIGPFALTDYNEIVGWGEMMVEVIDQNRMPPWHADPKFGTFANARFMSETDKQLIRDWVVGGMPLGDATELAKPTAIADGKRDQWLFGPTPDVVVTMSDSPFPIPASGTVEYQYYVVDPGFDEDVWIRGAEVRPGNRSVVHHCIVFVRPPDGTDMQGIGLLTAYVPGQRAAPDFEGHARRVPAGSQFVFQMHYTPTGVAEEDVTEVGLWLTNDKQVSHEVFTVTAIDHDFEIPPHAEDHSVEATRSRLPDTGQLLSATPHMHLRGKSFEFSVVRGEDRETLLRVPHYDFNWQHVYAFEKPIPLSDVDRLAIDVRFDNSANNPTNPDPEAYVFWGDQTDEEMAIGFFEVAVPRTDAGQQRRVDRQQPRSKKSREVEQVASETQSEVFAKNYISRYDQDGDNILIRDEMPLSIRRFGWSDLDRNRDGRLTRKEIETAHLRRQSR